MKYILLSLMFVATTVFAQTPSPSPTPSVVNVAITPAGAVVSVGATLQMHFSEIFSDETTKEVTPSNWVSSNIRLATISNSGLVTAFSPGVVSISATYNGLTTRTTISIGTPEQLKKLGGSK